MEGLYIVTMRCAYTQAIIKRRFGIPQGKSTDNQTTRQLQGTYGSVGILIRALLEKLNMDDPDSVNNVLLNLQRLGEYIKRPLVLKPKNDKGFYEYESSELKRLTDLAAPAATLLQINGGKMDFSEYCKKDKTWQVPEWDQYGQTEEEVIAQKERQNLKKKAKKETRVGREEDLYRIYYFGTRVTKDKDREDDVCRVSIDDLLASGYFHKEKHVRLIDTGDGLKIVYHGGSVSNKVASRKVYGAEWKNHPVLKGEVVVILTHRAPLVMDEYLEPDDDWLLRYREDHGIVTESSDYSNPSQSGTVGIGRDPIQSLVSGGSKKRKTPDE